MPGETFILNALLSLAPSILTGLVLFYWQRRQRKRDKLTDERAEHRRKESLLMLDMISANSSLTKATAIAVKEGKSNGEMTVAMEGYEAARKRYFAFLNEVAKENIL
jgi:hypothetical protein